MPESPRNFLKRIGRVEPDDEFDWEEFNPDVELDPEDLQPWINFIGQGVRPSHAANRWFPGQPGRVTAVRNIRNYLWNKKTAMRLRLDGNIQRALEYERIADRIYAMLPGYAKW